MNPIGSSITFSFILFLPMLSGQDGTTEEASPVTTPASSSQSETIAGTTVSFEMVQIPGGKIEVEDLTAESGKKELSVDTFWIGKTEVTWDEYDIFVFGLDGNSNVTVDAESRPTKPYINADRGFGHAGYAAMSISHKGADAYCKWLSQKTGKNFRLPTEEEWEFACRAGSTGLWCMGDDESELRDYAWYKVNADHKTQAVGTKKPNSLGIHDLHGNVAEWVTGPDGEKVTRGGSYLDGADRLMSATRRKPSRLWNASDPQIPKSVWWLCDAGFVGFRIVCDDMNPTSNPSENSDEGKVDSSNNGR